MPFLLVPQTVTSTEAELWIAIIDEPSSHSQIRLESNLGHHHLDPWTEWKSQDGKHTVQFQRLIVQGFKAGKSYFFRLQMNNQEKAFAEIRTLPDQLPTEEAHPFRILLGSCFCRREDREGLVERTFLRIPAALKPDLKIFCGDQVYLDSPWYRYSFTTPSRMKLESLIFENYLKTWHGISSTGSLNQLLRSNPNFFCSDDHEFWNNAPNAASFIPKTWSSQGRDEWLQIAKAQYRIFQGTSDFETFEVLPLSFFIADTRFERDADRNNFMSQSAFTAIADWINGLKGPGVLVVGQPVFTTEAGFWGRFTDWSLPDYKQYADLVRVLLSTRHSIVILTGDVHFGRVAVCDLRDGVRLTEIISSPMSLVTGLGKSKWKEAPETFPSSIPSAIGSKTVRTVPFRTTNEHFVTLQFHQTGAKVKMNVKLWPITEKISQPEEVYEDPDLI